MTLPQEGECLDYMSPSVSLLRHDLTEALRLRILNVPEPPSSPAEDIRIAILFSGGLDCTVLARLADEVLPANQGVDLINVAFENRRGQPQHARRDLPQEILTDVYEQCPDRATGRKAFAELKKACPARYWRFIAVCFPIVKHRQMADNIRRSTLPRTKLWRTSLEWCH